MSSFTLFLMVCLGPLVVMSMNRNFPPLEVPYPAQQCKDRLPNSDGECFARHGIRPVGNENPCRSLKCAVPNGFGGWSKQLVHTPRVGTICGILKACNRKGKCVDFEPDAIPTQTGIKTKRVCSSK